MLAILALESHRNRCVVIGEDLGTVPDEVRAALARAGVLSYRLLWFERDGAGEFKAPADFPREALVAVSTHDLPTLAGWWRGEDLALRRRLGLFPDEAAYAAQLAARAEDRARLLRALERAGLLPRDIEGGLAEAVHAYVGATPARVHDGAARGRCSGVAEQANLPGTTDEHPNWRRKLPLELERIGDHPRAAALAARLAGLRPHPEAQGAAPAPVEARVPRATYRLQLNAGFTFTDAIGLVPYLAKLGVSHVYCSPILRARPGSTHGYDVVDHDADQPRARQPRRLRPLRRRAARAGHGAAVRHGAQPHGRAWRRQRVVDGRAGERPGLGLCGVFRHRVAPGQQRPRGQGAGAGARRPLRHRARPRRAAPSLRGRRRHLRGALPRAPLPARPGDLSAGAAPRRSGAAPGEPHRGGKRGARGHFRGLRQPALARPQRRRGNHAPRDRDGEPQAAPAAPGAHAARRRRRARRGGGAHQRPAGRCAAHRCSKRRPTGSPTGASRPTRSTTGASSTSTTSRRCAWRTRRCSTPRTHSRSRLVAAAQGRRAAHRPPRRAVRPGAVFRATAGALRAHHRHAAECARRRRPASAAAVRGGGEDHRAPRARPGELGAARHHRLPLRRGGKRPVRRSRGARAHRPHLAQLQRRGASTSRRRPTSASAPSCAARSPRS